jgi:aspartyl-tRNA(Asn)/glutamyl-tRNA(Gln) amidotransferase subunit B
MSGLIKDKYKLTIGLETHLQLNTKCKLFSYSEQNDGAQNTAICNYDIATPGVLPILNEEAIVKAIKFGLATNSTINILSSFDRKVYSYPDLPSGYQITQYFKPIVESGYIEIDLNENEKKKINIVRAHLEQDAGKLIHDRYPDYSCVDFNRSGSVLLEIVTAPEIHNIEEVELYLRKIRNLVRYIDVSNANMEEGEFRCDVNISIAHYESKKLGNRCEIKNLNSFKFINEAINYEIERQIDIIESGGVVEQETRLFDSVNKTTHTLRSKENAIDYFYAPDPDLPTVQIDDNLIQSVKSSMSVSFNELIELYKSFSISKANIDIITGNKSYVDYLNSLVKINNSRINNSALASWMIGDFFALLNKNNIEINNSQITPEILFEIVYNVETELVSGKAGKEILLIKSKRDEKRSIEQIINELDFKQISDPVAIENVINEIFSEFTEQVEQYRNGKTNMIGFLVGKVIQKTKNKANPKIVNQMMLKKLSDK